MSKDSPSVSPVPRLDDLLCFAIHSAGFAFNRIYRGPLQRLGLTYPQYLVMVALWWEDDVTVGHLGEQLLLDTGTLTPLLKRLEAKGFLARRRSEFDERRVMIALTEKGRRLKRKAPDATDCVTDSAGLSLTELTRLTAEIKALRKNLENSAARSGAA